MTMRTPDAAPREKIVTLDELAAFVETLRAAGKKIVHCHGTFDLMHPGHIQHFEAAKRYGDVLIVTLTRDEHVNKGPGRPVFNHRLRAESIAALQAVDFVAVNEWPTAVETLRRLKPTFYVKGSDYADRSADVTGMIVEEERAVTEGGGSLVFTDEITFSSTELLNRYYDVYSSEARQFLDKFRTRHSEQAVISALKSLDRIRVLMIGETIIDEYHYCLPIGKSPKEAIVVTRYVHEESFAGGVLACANHAAGFCRDVKVLSGLGRDGDREEWARGRLKSNIAATFVYRDDGPTIVKRRYVWETFFTKLFEIAYFTDANISPSAERELVTFVEQQAPEYDVVLVADYGHGLLTPAVIEALCKHSKFLAVNTQTNSANTGYNLITKYPRADFVCIDEPEIRLAMGSRFDPIEQLMEDVAARLGAQAIAVTRGPKGSMTYKRGEGVLETPVFSTQIVDRVGAGDAYLSLAAPGVAAGWPMELVGFVGNAVGALAVRIVGNKTPIEPVALFKFVTSLLK